MCKPRRGLPLTADLVGDETLLPGRGAFPLSRRERAGVRGRDGKCQQLKGKGSRQHSILPWNLKEAGKRLTSPLPRSYMATRGNSSIKINQIHLNAI
jgi:hypothetical protein